MSTPKSRAVAGVRDRQITLVPRTDAVADSGFPTETEGTAITLWAAREDMGGRERIAFGQESAPFDTRWFLPFGDLWDPERINVPKAFSLEHGGREYDIVSAAIIGRRDGVELMTLARQG